MLFFRDLSVGDFKGATVFLDVDGTLVPDGENVLSNPESKKLKDLGEHATVFLVSNKNGERVKAMAIEHGVRYVDTEYKKPSNKVLAHVTIPEGKRFVIGDKRITDGMFAFGIHAEFIRIRRLKSGYEDRKAQLAALVDTLAAPFFSILEISQKIYVLPYLMLLRPRQWVKNILIAAPLFFAGDFFNGIYLWNVFLGILAFSFVSSAGYVINDTRDVHEDAQHSTKRFRPIAARIISKTRALIFTSILLIISLAIAFIVPKLFLWLILYLFVQVCYTFKFKQIPILEFLTVSALFVVRILAGGALVSVPVSSWLVLTTFFAALFVTAGKRYSEVKTGASRSVLKLYPEEFLQSLPVITAALAIIAYALYSILGTHYQNLVYTNIFVVFGIFWYLRDIYQGKAESPEGRLWGNIGILTSVVLWGISLGVLFYF